MRRGSGNIDIVRCQSRLLCIHHRRNPIATYICDMSIGVSSRSRHGKQSKDLAFLFVHPAVKY